MAFHWNIGTQIGFLVTWSLFIYFIILLSYRTRLKNKPPLLTVGLLTLGSFLFSFMTIVEEIPDNWMIYGTWLLVIGIIIAPWCILDLKKQATMSNLKFGLEYCAIIASSFSIIIVSYTLKLQRQQLHDSILLTEQMRDKDILKIIDDFLSPEMTKYKKLCEQLKTKLHTNPERTTHMLSYAFEGGIYDNTSEDWEVFKKSTDYAEYAAFVRVARFFNLVSRNICSENTAQAIHYYYIWWRPLIKEVTDIYNHTWENSIPTRRTVSFKVDWIEAPHRLDSILTHYHLRLE